jgi:diguanylate cyclase (GGDEF)-like protein
MKLMNYWNYIIENHPYKLTTILWLLCIPLIIIFTSYKVNQWENEQTNETITQTVNKLEIRKEQVNQDFDTVFKHLKSLPEFLSFEPLLSQALQSNGDTTVIDTTNNYLKNITRYLSVDLAFLTDKDGNCIASNNFDNIQNIIGINFQDRIYFKEAMKGKLGRQYAFGRKTNIPGLFFSLPIKDTLGNIIGIIATKANLINITQRIRLNEYFLTDDQGVIISAYNENLVFKALPNAPILTVNEEIKQKRYKRSNFSILSIESANINNYSEIILFNENNTPTLIQKIERPFDGFNAHLIETMPQLLTIKEQAKFIFILIVVGSITGLWTFFAAFIFIFRARTYRKNIQKSHDELLILNQLLKHQSETDFLTGCMNRRYFDKQLKETIAQHKKKKIPLSLAFFDIDHFKRINDNFGHDVGDKALQHLCYLVKTIKQDGDLLARLGGEEFALLMLNTELEVASTRIEALREYVAGSPLLYADLFPIQMTISVGVTAAQEYDTANTFLLRADNGMYQAKEMGRNQVVIC